MVYVGMDALERRWDGGTVGESFKRFIEPCSCFCAVMELSIDLCGDSCPPARPSGLPRRTRRASQRASASNVQHIPAPSAAKSRRRKRGWLVGEKDESWVLPRHTLRSRPVNPKPGCRAERAFSICKKEYNCPRPTPPS